MGCFGDDTMITAAAGADLAPRIGTVSAAVFRLLEKRRLALDPAEASMLRAAFVGIGPVSGRAGEEKCEGGAKTQGCK